MRNGVGVKNQHLVIKVDFFERGCGDLWHFPVCLMREPGHVHGEGGAEGLYRYLSVRKKGLEEFSGAGFELGGGEGFHGASLNESIKSVKSIDFRVSLFWWEELSISL